MAHTRIRKFNTSDTYPEQNLDNDLCQAVVTEGGKTVWLRGQCPQNLDDAVNLDSHDPGAQTHKVMQNIKQLIEEAGGTVEAQDAQVMIAQGGRVLVGAPQVFEDLKVMADAAWGAAP